MTSDLHTFKEHGAGLVFYCELHEAHHERVLLPHGWRKIGLDKFMIAMAPGWEFYRAELCKVWPEATDPKRSWRKYYQAGGSAAAVVV